MCQTCPTLRCVIGRASLGTNLIAEDVIGALEVVCSDSAGQTMTWLRLRNLLQSVEGAERQSGKAAKRQSLSGWTAAVVGWAH